MFYICSIMADDSSGLEPEVEALLDREWRRPVEADEWAKLEPARPGAAAGDRAQGDGAPQP